jgi:ubiquinone/menaquinone biosynthesis C-methylase UbiE
MGTGDYQTNMLTGESTKGIVKEGYDAIAPAYLAWSVPRPTTTRMGYINRLFSLLTPGAKVLELGCGAGVPCTQAFVKQGFDVTGVDISAAQIALAHQHVPEATLIQADMMSLSFKPETFDAIVALYSIFHLPKEEQGVMIRQIEGWLKEGGWLLLNLHSNEGNHMIDDWMGVKMFSSGLGVDGNREMFKNEGAMLKVVEDEVAVEKVGRLEERFHWLLAVKKGDLDV